MFICRAKLLRAHYPTRTIPPSSIRQVVPVVRRYANFNLLDVLYKHAPVVPPPVAEQSPPTSQPPPRTEDQPPPPSQVRATYTAEPAQDHFPRLPYTFSVPAESKKAPPLIVSPLREYLQSRQHSPEKLAERKPYTFLSLLNATDFSQNPHAAEFFIADVVKNYAPKNPGHRLELATFILRLLVVQQRVLTKGQILSLLQMLQDIGQLKKLQMNIRVPIARALIAMPVESIDASILELLVPLLVDIVEEQAATEEGCSARVVWPLYCIIQRLITLGQYHKALNVFHVLVQNKCVVALPVSGDDPAEKDFAFVVGAALVRSALSRFWHLRAKDILFSAIAASKQTTGVVHSTYLELAQEIMSSLLENPPALVSHGLSAVIDLIKLHVDHDAAIGPDNILLQEFYRAAHLANQFELAERVYGYSQKFRAADTTRRNYPAPPDDVLLWLMESLCLKTRNTGLARTLAKQVVDDEHPIPILSRAKFISLAASRGFAASARALWERYEKGPSEERVLVVGNAAATLRLVSVFADLIRRAGKKSGDEQVLELFPWMKDSSSHPPEISPEIDQGMVVESDVSADDSPAASDDVLDYTPRLPDTSTACDDPAGAEGSQHSSAQELRAFADRVLAEFRKTLEPLKQASHISLSSLARAYFLLGSQTEGFAIFDLMQQRAMLLDSHDLNVILSGVAHYDPVNAMQMLERMVKKGLMVDAVSFGTIIHFAILHGNHELVSSAIVRARELGIEKFSLKTLGKLLHATASMGLKLEGEAANNLEGARMIVNEMFSSGYTPTAKMGEDAVIAALRAKNPRLAFYFWKMLVKDKTEWDDGAQRWLRSRIARQIRARHFHEQLARDMAQSMLVQLDEGSLLMRPGHHQERRSTPPFAQTGGPSKPAPAEVEQKTDKEADGG